MALPTKKTLVGLIAALALLAAAPGSATASTMGTYGNYEGDPGPNSVTTSFDGTFTTFTDSAGIALDPGATDPSAGNCAVLSGSSVRCAYPHGYRLSLEGGNDSFGYVGAAPPNGAPSGKLFRVQGGDGVDLISGSPYDDDLYGDGDFDGTPDPAGNDQILGNGGDDALYDNDGANRFDGGPGNDKIIPGDGTDTVDGGDGDDLLTGGGGNDIVRGGAGKDDVGGGAGSDIADGGPGDDVVQASFHGGGCGGAETLIGGSGRDSLYAACAAPAIFKLRDGERDKARCLPAVRAATVELDKKLDEVTGGACERSNCGKKGKAKKGSTTTPSAAKKRKGCRKKGKRK